jgi:hypothetical protein
MLTTILVRPAARGGKFLGPDAANSDNQSALITLLNGATNEVIDHRYVSTLGKDPGPTDVMAPVSRAEPFATDPNTVGATFSLDIPLPTQLRVLVYGPLKHPDQARTAEARINLLPGVDIGSPVKDAQLPTFPQGLVIEIPGLCISNVKHDLSGPKLSCSAKVTMMCGCEIHDDPTWFWPSGDFNIQLWTYTKSGALYQYSLQYDTKAPNGPSYFCGAWDSLAAPGDSIVSAWITASQPKMGNQGYYAIA